MSADLTVSPRGRFRIILVASILLAVLIGMAGVRLARLAHEIRVMSDGYGRVRRVLVRDLRVDERRITQETTVGDLLESGVRRTELIRALSDEFGKELTDDDLPATRTLAELGDQLEG